MSTSLGIAFLLDVKAQQVFEALKDKRVKYILMYGPSIAVLKHDVYNKAAEKFVDENPFASEIIDYQLMVIDNCEDGAGEVTVDKDGKFGREIRVYMSSVKDRYIREVESTVNPSSYCMVPFY